jgi:hypothetical protein
MAGLCDGANSARELSGGEWKRDVFSCAYNRPYIGMVESVLECLLLMLNRVNTNDVAVRRRHQHAGNIQVLHLAKRMACLGSF